MKKLNLIEPLEERIAPATIVNPYTVTYQNYETNSNGNQIQGDTVVVKFSRPLFKSVSAAQSLLEFTGTPNGSSITESFTGNGTAESLGEINLQGVNAAAGMNISVTVIPQVGVGNGNVTVGDINAGLFSGNTFSATGNIPLGSVYVQGNLEQISAGGDFSSIPAIQSLTVGSFGGGNASIVLGTIEKMNVQGNFTAFLDLIGYQFGAINQLNIGGSLTGDSAGDASTGIIQFLGHIGSATIGSIAGTAGQNTGELLGTTGYIGSLHVKGSITGGSSPLSGVVVIAGGNLGKLTVDGGITGGSAAQTGLVDVTAGSVGPVSIGGSITGGSATSAGEVKVEGSAGTVTVVGSMTGGSGEETGSFLIGGNLASIHVLGSITGGSGDNTGFLDAGGSIGHVTVGGSILGGSAGTAEDTSTSAAAVAGISGVIQAISVGTITIGGSLVGGTPDASVVTSDGTANATADSGGAIFVNSVGSITIMGSIIGSGGATTGVIDGTHSSIFTKFGSIVVDGDVVGGGGLVSGVIEAHGLLGGEIGSVHIGGNLTGNSGVRSGQVSAPGGFGSVYIGGNVTGGSADTTGEIDTASALTSLHIGGFVMGSTGTHSGFITTGTTLGTLYLGGNLTAGMANDTGEISVGGTLTNATINGNLTGAAASSTTALVGAGYISAGEIGILDITGNVTSGTNSMGAIANSGAIRSFTDIKTLTIGGAVTGVAGDPVIISAQQGPGNGAHLTSDLAIGNVTIDGAASFLDILAGYSPTVGTNSAPAATPLGTLTDGAAQMGALSFLSLNASNIVAGAKADSKGQFGTTGDTAVLPRTGAFAVISSIAKITVTDAATGDGTSGDNFGIVAEQLGIVEVNNSIVPTATLTPGTPVLVPASGNLYLLEPLVI